MLVSKRVKGQAGLLEFFRGALIAQGKNLTNTGSSADISVPAAAGGLLDFTGVAVGDVVYISGELTATVFLVTAPGLAATTITLDNVVVAAHTADGIWKIFRGGIPYSALLTPPMPDQNEHGMYVLVYETDTFGV